jgi:hypothetical protein
MTLTLIALWALVLALGVQTGAGIYETRVVVPLWGDDPPASLTAFHAQPRKPDSGRRLWMILTPITTLISLFNLVLALLSRDAMRGWWIAASAASVFVMAVTFAYFVPELISFARTSAQPPANVAPRVRRWVALNYVRAVTLIAAWLAALQAFSMCSRA